MSIIENGKIEYQEKNKVLNWAAEYAKRELEAHRKRIPLDHAAKSVTGQHLADGAVTENKLEAGAVTEDKLSEQVRSRFHQHANKDALDAITPEKIEQWDNAVPKDGSIEKRYLAAAVQAELNKAHTHTNKIALDMITQQNIQDWNQRLEEVGDNTVSLEKLTDEVRAMVNKAHRHQNQTELDSITAAKITQWDSVSNRVQCNFYEALTSMDALNEPGLYYVVTVNDGSLPEGVMGGVVLVSKDHERVHQLLLGTVNTTNLYDVGKVQYRADTYQPEKSYFELPVSLNSYEAKRDVIRYRISNQTPVVPDSVNFKLKFSDYIWEAFPEVQANTYYDGAAGYALIRQHPSRDPENPLVMLPGKLEIITDNILKDYIFGEKQDALYARHSDKTGVFMDAWQRLSQQELADGSVSTGKLTSALQEKISQSHTHLNMSALEEVSPSEIEKLDKIPAGVDPNSLLRDDSQKNILHWFYERNSITPMSYAYKNQTYSPLELEIALGTALFNQHLSVRNFIGIGEALDTILLNMTPGVIECERVEAWGADSAKFFEWADGNPDQEDRVGLFVTLEGEKIKPASAGEEYVLGIVSGMASFVGNAYESWWSGRYLKDIYGRKTIVEKEIPPVVKDGVITQPARTVKGYAENPRYRKEEKYIPRSQRPEWDVIGIAGIMVLRDDGSCSADGYCKPAAGGIGTRAEEITEFRVLKRLDESHIRVFVKGGC